MNGQGNIYQVTFFLGMHPPDIAFSSASYPSSRYPVTSIVYRIHRTIVSFLRGSLGGGAREIDALVDFNYHV